MASALPQNPPCPSSGGINNGPPGIRVHYHPNYYGAFVHDPDGHNIKAAGHEPEDQ